MRSRLAAMALSLLVGGCAEQDPPDSQGLLPWDVRIDDAGNSRVFAITLDSDSFADAEKTLGSRYETALFGNPGEVPSLEVFYPQIAVNGLTGRLILNLRLPDPVLRGLRDRSPGERVQLEGSGRRWQVAADDLATVRSGVVNAIAYVPGVDLEPDVISARFGPPAQRIELEDGAAHWLYPDRGLDIRVNPEGRELLQYVSPAEFHRLRAPLEHSTREEAS